MPFENVEQFENVDRLFHENPTRTVRRFIKDVGRGINRYDMIGDGETVLLSISGGKDSLALALGLSLRRRFIPIHYDLEAVLIDFREHPHRPENLDLMRQYFRVLHVPFKVITADMQPDSFGGRFDCYRCSRNRKRILFDEIRGRSDISKIATGHHLDDLAQTTLMNVLFRGSFGTMLPVQPLFDGNVQIIRPMCDVPEEKIQGVADHLKLPVSTIDCPFKNTNIRTALDRFLNEMRRINPYVRENIVRSHTNINHDYLPDR